MSPEEPEEKPAEKSDDTPVEPVENPPLLRIVKGDPTPEEVAALVTVVSAMAAGAQAADGKGASKPEWSAHHHRLRTPLRHGPGAWRASAR